MLIVGFFQELIERSEDGDQAALKELESTVPELDKSMQLQFYKLREQCMARRAATLTDTVPAASDDDWRQVMTESIERFQQIGRKLQQIERGRHVSISTTFASEQPQERDENQEIVSSVLSRPSYSSATEIDQHTTEDVGKYFEFTPQNVPEGLAGTISDEFALTNNRKMILRPQAHRILSKVAIRLLFSIWKRGLRFSPRFSTFSLF
jgi:hypothetical protein